MRKILTAVLITLTLGGCAQIQTAAKLTEIATKSYDNPVTERELFEIEASLRIVVEGLVTYRRACLVGSVDLRCKENIRAIQPYTRQVPGLLAELRGFVKSKDQINAIVVYKRLGNLYNSITSTATTRGVNLGA